jgi:hypothetical protein
MLSRNLSSQGAITVVVNLLKHKVHSFLDLESSLQSLSHSRTSDDNSSYSSNSWITSPIKSMITTTTRTLTSNAGKEKPRPKTPLIKSLSSLRPHSGLSHLVGDVDAYTRFLRDYISGNVHWFYETELYFGTKGEEVKAFGWVFLNTPQVVGEP